MRFAAVQFDITWEDKPANHAIIEHMLDEASPAIEPGAFVLLPELGDTGFSFNLDRIVDDVSLQWAQRIAQERRIWLQAGYAERERDGKGRNCAAIISPDGVVQGVYQKVHPFSYGKEIEHFSGGHSLLIAKCSEFNVCPMICYDLRFPELWRMAVLKKQSGDRQGTHEAQPVRKSRALPDGRGSEMTVADVFTIGASWPAARQSHWRALLIARAIENQAYVVAVNRIGDDPHIKYSGGSIIISPTGEILAEAPAGNVPIVLQAELDPAALQAWRDTFPALADIHRELLGSIPRA